MIYINDLRVNKEYIGSTKETGNEIFRFIVDKIHKDRDGNIVKIIITMVNGFKSKYEYTPKEFNFENIIEPISSTEFFAMYTNFNNFFNKGVNQDLTFAKETAYKILQTIKKRTIVSHGSGKFEEYDKILFDRFFTSYNSLN